MPADPAFAPVPAEPDHVALEHRVLERWDREGTFARLREQNEGGPVFSFTDGPITANNPMGVHHAWGRSLKDLFQRYHAALGQDLRYQNGFDCQGLWVEVEVERALGLNSKHEIEAYGLDRFARACRDRVAEYSGVQTAQSRRLGLWMDWERSYYTMTDPNISYIWGFLKICHERGWLYQGHRPMVWCLRCGTSLSQHEVTATDSYRDIVDESLYVRFRFTDVAGESLVIWTTTPWTLPANVAAAVKPDAEYVWVEVHGERHVVARDRCSTVFGPDARIAGSVRGEELVGRPYATGFDDLPAQADVLHRVVADPAIVLDEGTGIVHIAPGCGAEDFEIGRREELPVLVPVDEAGLFIEDYGELAGHSAHEVPDLVADHLRPGGWLVRQEPHEHRYPHCWRCGTKLIFRVVDEWFIRCDEIRQPMIDANNTVEWTPSHFGKRMEDWLRNMGDWCISRKRYWGLPLPFWFCPDGHMNVVASREELRERATAGLEGLHELHRPWIDPVTIDCAECGAEAVRVPEVGDCWLDAGIVPFSTLGYGRDTYEPEGFAAGAGVGLTKADLPDHAYWEKWFPADWISEMREQIRLWFYSQLFMSVALVGRAPYRRVLGYEKLHDEHGRAMHKSWGNAIWFDDAIEKIGADVSRWMFAGQDPGQNMNFGYGPASDVARRLLTLWNTYRFLVLNANPEGFRPLWEEADRGPESDNPLDRWVMARASELARDCRAALDAYDSPSMTRAVEAFWDDLSNWYVRRSRPRFWEGDRMAFATLHHALVQCLRIMGPVTPFLADELWENLVANAAGADAPSSVHLAGYPEPDDVRIAAGLLGPMADVRAICELGHRARAEAKLRVRQPLASAIVASGDAARLEALTSSGLLDEIANELNVKAVTTTTDLESLVEQQVVANFRVLGPRLGSKVQDVRAALAAGDYALGDDGVVEVAAEQLAVGEYELRSHAREGFEAQTDGTLVVAIDTRVTDELALEGTARDIVRFLQNVRKELGFDVSDRIAVRWAANERGAAVLGAHGDWIAREVLAERFEPGEGGEHRFAAGGAEIAFEVARA
jgi:isoleucyl-tRNA synthetase